MPPIVGDQPVPQRPVGLDLQTRIERRPHRQPAAVELGFAEPVGELAADLLDEIFGLGDQHLVGGPHFHRTGPGQRRLGPADAAVLQHPADHVVPPRPRGLGPALRVVVVGRFGKSGQKGRLGQRELVEGFVEIVYRRRRDAVGAETEIDLVEIEFEDALLGQRPFDPEGENDLSDLAPVGNGVGQEEVLRHLLGDGGRPDGPPVGADPHDVLDRRRRDAGEVDAGMFEERLVLGGDEGADDPPGHGRDRNEDPLFSGEFGEKPTVSGMDPAHHRGFVVGELGMVREIAAIAVEQPDHAAAGEKPDDDEQQSQYADRLQNAHVDRDETRSVPV